MYTEIAKISGIIIGCLIVLGFYLGHPFLKKWLDKKEEEELNQGGKTNE